MLEALKRQDNAEGQRLSPSMDVRIAEVVAALREQAAAVERIHALLSRDNFAVEGGLYHIADGLIVDRPPTWRPRDVYVYVLLLFAAMTAVVIVGSAFRPRQAAAGV